MAHSTKVYWSQGVTWDGYTGSWMDYIQVLHTDLQVKILECKDNTEKKKLLERVARFLSIIYDEKINSRQEMAENELFQYAIAAIKKKYSARILRNPVHPNTVDLRNRALARDGFDKMNQSHANLNFEHHIGVPSGWSSDEDVEMAVADKVPNEEPSADEPNRRVPYIDPRLTEDTLPHEVRFAESDPENFGYITDDNVSVITDVEGYFASREESRTNVEIRPLKDIWHYIQMLLEASTSGRAKEAVTQDAMRMRNGFRSLGNLAETFGQGDEHLLNEPHQFQWGGANGPLDRRWIEYKNLIDGFGILKKFKNIDPLVVLLAKNGFAKYHNSRALLNYCTTELPRNPTWYQFKQVVDKFLGDHNRDDFNRFKMLGQSSYLGTMPMDCSAIMKKPQQGEVNSMFNAINPKPNNKVGKGKGKGQSSPNKGGNKPSFPQRSSNSNKGNLGKSKGTGKGNGKSITNSGSNSQNKTFAPNTKGKSKGKPAPKKKPNPPRCGWCGSNHPSYACKDKNNPKWANYQCKLCKGWKHPEAVCTLQGVKKN